MVIVLGLAGLVMAVLLMVLPQRTRQRAKNAENSVAEEKVDPPSTDGPRPMPDRLFRAPSAGALHSPNAEKAAVISDFDIAIDRLEITYEDRSGKIPVVTVGTDGPDATVALDGVPVARVPDVNGLTAEHIELVRAG